MVRPASSPRVVSAIRLSSPAGEALLVAGTSVLLGALIAVSLSAAIAAGAIVAAITLPRWCLAVGAVAATVVVPPDALIVGPLQVSDLFFGAFLVRELVAVRAGSVGASQWWLIAFLAWAWLSLVLVGGATAPALARITLYGAALVALSRGSDGRKVVLAIAGLAVIEVFLALAMGQLGGRFVGTLGDPHAFGVLQLAGLAASLALPKGVRRFAVPVILFGILFTLTRGIWAAAVLEIALLTVPMLRAKARRLAIIATVLLVGALLLEPEVTESLDLNPDSREQRITSIVGGLDLVESNPLFGVGWAQGETLTPFRDQPPYSLWVNVAATTGLVGLFFIAGFFVAAFRALVRRADPIGQSGLVFLAGFSVLSLSIMPFYAGADAAIIFFVYLGATLASQRQRPEPTLAAKQPAWSAAG